MIKTMLKKVKTAKYINISLHPIIGKKYWTGKLEDNIPMAPTINIQELARCWVWSWYQILYAVSGPIRHAPTPTPIKILETRSIVKFCAEANKINPIIVKDKK